MKKLLSIVALCLAFACSTEPEHYAPHGYVIHEKGDSVRFIFDRSMYKRVTRDDSPIWIEMDQINIKTVSVVGDMNSWDKTSMTMVEEPSGLFELHYPAHALDTDSVYAFKFLINDFYWVEPTSSAPNREETMFNHKQNKSYNFQLKL